MEYNGGTIPGKPTNNKRLLVLLIISQEPEEAFEEATSWKFYHQIGEHQAMMVPKFPTEDGPYSPISLSNDDSGIPICCSNRGRKN